MTSNYEIGRNRKERNYVKFNIFLLYLIREEDVTNPRIQRCLRESK